MNTIKECQEFGNTTRNHSWAAVFPVNVYSKSFPAGPRQMAHSWQVNCSPSDSAGSEAWKIHPSHITICLQVPLHSWVAATRKCSNQKLLRPPPLVEAPLTIHGFVLVGSIFEWPAHWKICTANSEHNGDNWWSHSHFFPGLNLSWWRQHGRQTHEPWREIQKVRKYPG